MTNDEIKAKLYDLNNAMERLSDRQLARWERFKDLEKQTEEARWLYNQGTYDVNDVHQKIKELEAQLDDNQ